MAELRRTLAVFNTPVFGGGTNMTMRLARPLGQHGWRSQAIVPDLPEALATQERMEAGGVPTRRMELHRMRKGLDPRPNLALGRTFPREVARLRTVIRRERIDLVQAFGATNPHAALAGHLEGKAVVWTLYDTVLPPALAAVPTQLVTRIADVVLTWGRQLAHAHPGAVGLGDRCITVYPPVDPDVFQPDPERRARARRELGVPDDAVLLGTVGNRNPTKGHDHLVRVARALRDAGHDVWVRVLGQPSPVHAEHMAMVEDVARDLGMEDRVAFVDPGRRVPELLPALDLYAMSSVPRSEGVPTVIFEAMACELPVITTDVGAVREFVEEGVTGFVVPSLDDDALTAALLRLLDDPELRRRLGATARERILERYRVERCAEVYADAFELALSHRSRR